MYELHFLFAKQWFEVRIRKDCHVNFIESKLFMKDIK